jgi:SOS-response transcriptional repressor LexA
MNSNERLREVVESIKKQHNFTNEALSNALKYTTLSYVSDILGGSKPVSDLFLKRLKEYFNVNPNYITDNVNPIFFDQSNNAESYTEKRRNLKNNKQNTLTFYDIGAAAGPVGDILPVKKSEGVLHISDLFQRSQFAIRISGNSMMPNYPPGSIIGIREMENNLITPGTVYVIETHDELRIKRLFYKDDNQDSEIYECVSDNTMRFQNGGREGKLFYPPFYVHFTEVRRLFKVTGMYKANELTVIS